MPVDPMEPATFTEDTSEPEPVDLEAPEADAAEQMTEVLPPPEDEPLADRDLLEADPADAVEQTRVVREDEDDYR